MRSSAAGAGQVFEREVSEQPATLRALAGRSHELGEIAAAIVRRRPRLIRLVGHGSSDNAASFGVYAFGLIAAETAFRDSISLSVYYGAELDLAGSCVLALSQSGRTPDVVDYLGRARRRGAFTVALTNERRSPLAEAADAVVELGAGVEHAVAATKTYSAELAALALLAAHLAGEGARYAEALLETAERLEGWLAQPHDELTALARELRPAARMLILGRGPEYATAREIALKLLEACRLAAAPLTATDFAHGPVAALDAEFPTWVIASNDASLPGVLDAAARAHAAGGTVIASGAAASALAASARVVVPVPEAPLPLLGPLLSIAPGQRLALALARAKGLDPDHPSGLEKVTLAR